jgi:hypothetical protein
MGAKPLPVLGTLCAAVPVLTTAPTLSVQMVVFAGHMRRHRFTIALMAAPYCTLCALRLPVSDPCPAADSECKNDGTGRDDTEHGHGYLVPGHTDSVRRVAFRTI